MRLAERLPYPGLAMRGHWAMEITHYTWVEFALAMEHFEKALRSTILSGISTMPSVMRRIQELRCGVLPPGRCGFSANPIRL